MDRPDLDELFEGLPSKKEPKVEKKSRDITLTRPVQVNTLEDRILLDYIMALEKEYKELRKEVDSYQIDVSKAFYLALRKQVQLVTEQLNRLKLNIKGDNDEFENLSALLDKAGKWMKMLIDLRKELGLDEEEISVNAENYARET